MWRFARRCVGYPAAAPGMSAGPHTEEESLMSTGTRVAVALASGMLLGRTKKQKLAITVGGLLLGRKIDTDSLIKQGQGVLEGSPELSRLTEQVRGTLLEAVRAAAIAAASKRLDAVSDSLHERSERMRSGSSEEAEDEEA